MPDFLISLSVFGVTKVADFAGGVGAKLVHQFLVLGHGLVSDSRASISNSCQGIRASQGTLQNKLVISMKSKQCEHMTKRIKL